MRRAVAVVLMAALILAVAAPPAQACIECVALGLAAFAVFNQFVWAVSAPRVVYTAPYYAPYYAPAYGVPYGWPYAPPYYAPAPYYPVAYSASYRATPYVAAAAPGTWTGARVVQYPHGRYELRGDGVTVPWAWVWVPAAAMPVANAPAAMSVGFPQDGPEGSGGTRTP